MRPPAENKIKTHTARARPSATLPPSPSLWTWIGWGGRVRFQDCKQNTLPSSKFWARAVFAKPPKSQPNPKLIIGKHTQTRTTHPPARRAGRPFIHLIVIGRNFPLCLLCRASMPKHSARRRNTCCCAAAARGDQITARNYRKKNRMFMPISKHTSNPMRLFALS